LTRSGRSGQARIIAEQDVEQLLGGLDGQGIQPHLTVDRLAPPGVLVLRPVVHQQEQPRGSEGVDEGVEQRLGLAVDPVEVLEDHEQRLLARFPQQEPLDGVERVLPALRRLEAAPGRVVDGHVDQRQERRQHSLQRSIEREQPPGHLLADRAQVVPVADREVRPE
jgi:hypothetical protein